MSKNILVTGGSGFIGSHLVNHLLEKNNNVTVIDNFDPQVHGLAQNETYEQENKNLHIIKGDIRDKPLLITLIQESDTIIHLAAKVGVGQSMYEIENYVDNNTRGTASLLDILVNREHNIKKLIVASSMSVYGEGSYQCPNCGNVNTDVRSEEELKKGIWDFKCKICNSTLKHKPTDETKELKPTSIYGMTKRHQEEMTLLTGKTYGIPTTAFRFFNVYGPGQALSNPYTGCIAIFSSRVLNGNSPLVFEDGHQLRDFIFVKDLVNAITLPLETSACDYKPVNVGSGSPIEILEIAQLICTMLKTKIKPAVTGQYRVGDIRHCYADITVIRNAGFKTSYALKAGLQETIDWASKQESSDLTSQASGQLKQFNLIRFGK